MKNKKLLQTLLITAVITLIVTFGAIQLFGSRGNMAQTASVAAKSVGSEISADGTIRSENEAVLHFQTGGKLTYLPYKEGDKVALGQTLASLDTTILQKELQAAANTLQATNLSSDQTAEHNQAGVLNGQQRTTLDTTNKNAYNGITESQVITDDLQRIIAQNNLSVSSATLAVQIDQYAIQLASLTAPFSGVITHEDVTVPGVNVTTETAFSMSDPATKVFRANVLATDIDFVSVGADATIHIDGQNSPYSGVVSKISPEKTSVDGQDVYQVDIQTNNLTSIPFDQTGSVQIQSNTQSTVLLIPSWTVVGHNTVWVLENGLPVRKTVTIGKIHGDLIEVTSGLSSSDNVITNPDTVARTKYKLL